LRRSADGPDGNAGSEQDREHNRADREDENCLRDHRDIASLTSVEAQLSKQRARHSRRAHPRATRIVKCSCDDLGRIALAVDLDLELAGGPSQIGRDIAEGD
jgi:hypothetical protein